MEELTNGLVDKLAGHWLTKYWVSAVLSLLGSWLLVRQRYLKSEYDSMKQNIQTLQHQHTQLDSTLDNVKKNQELMRESQKEIGRDVKLLLKNSKPKAWWQ